MIRETIAGNLKMHSQAEMVDYFKQCMLSPVEQVNQWIDLKGYCRFKSMGWMAGGDEGAQYSVEFMRELSANAFAAGALLGAFATMLMIVVFGGNENAATIRSRVRLGLRSPRQ
jgi:hypothetical protein